MSAIRAIDTASFDAVTDIRADLVAEYARIDSEYDRIVSTLLENWRGNGADAFRADAERVKTNIGGIHDVLRTMCHTLTDCREIIGIADSQIGDANANPFSGE